MEKKYNEHVKFEPIREACIRVFEPGVLYKREMVKKMLQNIYDSIGLIGKHAKAIDLESYLPVQNAWYMEDGKRNVGYILPIGQ